MTEPSGRSSGRPGDDRPGRGLWVVISVLAPPFPIRRVPTAPLGLSDSVGRVRQYCYCREKHFCPFDDLNDFGYVIKVKENAPELLRRALSQLPVDLVMTGNHKRIAKSPASHFPARGFRGRLPVWLAQMCISLEGRSAGGSHESSPGGVMLVTADDSIARQPRWRSRCSPGGVYESYLPDSRSSCRWQKQHEPGIGRPLSQEPAHSRGRRKKHGCVGSRAP